MPWASWGKAPAVRLGPKFLATHLQYGSSTFRGLSKMDHPVPEGAAQTAPPPLTSWGLGASGADRCVWPLRKFCNICTMRIVQI